MAKLRVPRRNRYEVKYFFRSGASLQWSTTVEKSLSWEEMVKGLREIADVIERDGQRAAPPDPEP
jgi:hypothetical protein